MIENVETLAESRLSLVLSLDQVGRLRPSDVEGQPSRSSRDLALAWLEGTARFYTGTGGVGLGALVETVAPRMHDEASANLDAAVTA